MASTLDESKFFPLVCDSALRMSEIVWSRSWNLVAINSFGLVAPANFVRKKLECCVRQIQPEFTYGMLTSITILSN